MATLLWDTFICFIYSYIIIKLQKKASHAQIKKSRHCSVIYGSNNQAKGFLYLHASDNHNHKHCHETYFHSIFLWIIYWATLAAAELYNVGWMDVKYLMTFEWIRREQLRRRRGTLLVFVGTEWDHLCGLVVRVVGYRSGSSGSIPGTTRKKAVGLERGPLSLVSTTEELLDRKVAASV
jgi:hypothetical protein